MAVWFNWNWLLGYLGVLTPRLHLYDVALAIAADIRRTVSTFSAGAAQEQQLPADPTSVQPAPPDDPTYVQTTQPTDRTSVQAASRAGPAPAQQQVFLAAQVEELDKFIAWHRLIGRDDKKKKGYQLASIAKDIVSGGDRGKIISALDRLVGLLETKRAILAGRTRDRRPEFRTAAAAADPVAATPNGTTATDQAPAPPAQPSELAVLWTTTEKLYDSWPFKLLGLLLVSAILLAGGGTLLIGGQALQLRKNLEDAGGKEASSIETLAKSTREAVKNQAQILLDDLNRQQTEINIKIARADQQIRDLEGRSEQIKSQAVDRVVTEIRKDYGALERKLNDELERSLNNIKERDISDLQDKIKELRPEVQALTKQVGEDQTSISRLAPGIKVLVDTAAGAETLKGQVAFVLDARNSAEEALRRTDAHEDLAAAAQNRVERLLKDVEDRLKLQYDKLLENENKLGGNDKGLSLLFQGLQKAGFDSAGIQKILEGVNQTRDSVSSMDRRLLHLEAAADDLDKRVKQIAAPPPPTKPPEETPPRTEDSLSADEWITIQRSLKSRRLYSGKLDGNAGPGTHTAIEKYQDRRKEPKTKLTPDQIKDLLR
jgi:hypothetical protein